jgi:hypothetical protein
MTTVRKKRTRGFDAPPENVADVDAHKIRFDAELDKLHAKQGYNSQIFTKDKLTKIMATLDNYEQMTWPVIPLHQLVFIKCRLLMYVCPGFEFALIV